MWKHENLNNCVLVAGLGFKAKQSEDQTVKNDLRFVSGFV